MVATFEPCGLFKENICQARIKIFLKVNSSEISQRPTYIRIKEFPLFVYLGPVAASRGPSPPVHPLREPGNVKKSYNLTVNLAQLQWTSHSIVSCHLLRQNNSLLNCCAFFYNY